MRRAAVRNIVDKLYTCILNLKSPDFGAQCEHRRERMREGGKPREDSGLTKQMEVLANGLAKTGLSPRDRGRSFHVKPVT